MALPLARTLVCALVLVASAPAARADDPVSARWRWTRFTTESGLPADGVVAMAEASDGTLFARTTNGLAWFDGYVWRAVPHSSVLPSRAGARLEPDGAGGVVAVAGDLVLRIDRDGMRVEAPIGGGPAAESVVALDERALLALERGILLRLADGVVEPFEPQPPEPATDLGRTRFGTLWVTTASASCALRDGRWIRVPGPASLYEDRSGGWLAIERAPERARVWSAPALDGLWTVEAPEPGAVAAADVDAHGNALVTYLSGRVEQRRGGVWSTLERVPSEIVQPFFLRFDRRGDLWAGVDDGLALCRLSSRRWGRLRIRDAPDSTRVNALLESRDGRLWIGTSEGLFVHGPAAGFERVELPPGTDVAITGLAQTPDGALWASSGADERGFGGALRFADGAWRHVGAAEGLAADRVHRIALDRSGRPWFLGIARTQGDDEPGAWVREHDGSFTRWGTGQGLPSGRVYAFDEAHDGSLWFGTWRGLSRWRDGEWLHWGLDEGLRAPRVYSISAGDDGRVWFGHAYEREGAGWLDSLGDDPRPRYLDEQDGLVHGDVREVAHGPDGTLWIATSNGLAGLKDGELATFDRASGLAHPHLWPILPRARQVLVGTMGGGVYALALEDVDAVAPRVTLAPPAVSESGALLRWRASAWHGAQPSERVATRSRLDGGPWTPWSLAREATALGLAPGDHALEVQAKSLLGGVGERTARAEFHVPPPFWRSRTFLAAVAAWAATMIVLAAWLLARQRRRQRGLLRAHDRHHRALVDELPIGLHELDREGRILTANPTGLRLLGARSEAHVLGAPFLDGVEAADRPHVREQIESALAGTACELAFRGAATARILSATLSPHSDERGSVAKLTVTLRDVTARERAETRRRELESQLLHAQKMEAIGLLAGGVAHDFNNLLTVIGGHASLLEEHHALPWGLRAHVDAIQHAHERAERLTRQLLAFGRRQVMNLRTVALADVAASLADMLRRLIGPHIELVLDLAPDTGYVRADPSQLEQIVVNLAVNARDAMPSGGRLEIRTERRRYHAALVVRDTGCGMDAETRARIFEPFFTTKGFDEGTGLGLSTVYGIVEQSGGRITVESEPNCGATFSVLLPAVAAPEPERSEPAAEPPPRAARGTETVLVVDDDPALLALVADVLSRDGYTVHRAGDGPSALRVLHEHGGELDLLLTDLVMPGLDGEDLVRSFLERRPEGSVLRMSGYAHASVVSRTAWETADTLLHKPFTPAELRQAARRALDARPAPLRPVELARTIHEASPRSP